MPNLYALFHDAMRAVEKLAIEKAWESIAPRDLATMQKMLDAIPKDAWPYAIGALKND